jgi:hypothetical protein
LAVADNAGLVIAIGADVTQLSNPGMVTDYEGKIVTVDLQGTLKQIWSGEYMPVKLAADTSNVYFQTLDMLGGSDLVSVPRAGGTPTVVLEDAVYAGPVLAGGKLYFAGSIGSVLQGIYAVDPAGGAPTLLSNRGNVQVYEIVAGPDSLYWTEFSSLSDQQFPFFRLKFTDNTVEQLGSLPVASGADHLYVVGSDIYSSGLVETTFPLNRVTPGHAPVTLVAETTGAISFSSSAAYYGSLSGLVKTPLDFSVTQAISGTSSLGISAVAVGPDSLWYAEQRCIYRGSL